MSIFEKLIEIFNVVFDGEIETTNITTESNLRDDIEINSIGILYMAMAIEEEFGIKFANDDFTQITTIADVIDIIEKKTAV